MDTRGCLFVYVFCVVIYGVLGNPGHGSLCSPNERFLSCGGCQKTCLNPAPECTSVCRTGCYCMEDEVRNATGHCIKLSECPSMEASTLYSSEPRLSDFECPPDEEYRSCEPCNKTCQNPNPICPAQCARGCFCRDELVRHKDGRCVKLENCSSIKLDDVSNAISPEADIPCPELQEYYSCKYCERHCNSPTAICTEQCNQGCFCKSGYLKSPDGSCVMLSECPTEEIAVDIHEPSIEDCSPDEVYLSCGWCEPSCSEPKPECPVGVCTRGCLCRPPMLRHHSGHCVTEENCTPQKCSDQNEEYVCRYGCEARCDVLNCTSDLRQCTLGCHCKLGMRRHNNGKCVPPQMCNLNNTEIKKTTKENTAIVQMLRENANLPPVIRRNFQNNNLKLKPGQKDARTVLFKALLGKDIVVDFANKTIWKTREENTIGFAKDSLMTGEDRCTDCPCVFGVFRC